LLANARMTASVPGGTWRGGWTSVAAASLALAPVPVLLPVALVATELSWIRFVPLAVAGVLASVRGEDLGGPAELFRGQVALID